MTLTSLGLASDGLLDRGDSPALHMASLGHLRITPVSIDPGDGVLGGAIGLRPQFDSERLEKLEKKIKVASLRDLLSDLERTEIDIDRLETFVRLALELRPEGQRKVELSVDPDEIRLPIDDQETVEHRHNINLRLILLLAV